MKIIKWNGKPITKPGVYSDIPLERYHEASICDGPSISSSHLRRGWAETMAHLFDAWPGNPNYKPTDVTRPMILGSAAHHLMLGQDKFNVDFIGQPLTYRDKKTAEEKSWNNNAGPCIEWNAKQKKAGRTIVKQDELKRIIGMAKSLRLEPLVDELLHGHAECSMFVKDGETGLWIKCRPDMMPSGADYLDIKITGEIFTVAVQSSIRTRGYHMQGGLTWEVCDQLGLPFESFILLFVESDRPFCVYPVPIADEDLARGRMMCRVILRRVAACLQTGVWPGPFDGNLRPLGISLEERARIDAILKAEGLA